MNRLILIGNGFDLAHGFKTSFKNFIDAYFLKAITKLYNEFKFDDDLLKTGRRDGQGVIFQDKKINLSNVYEKIESIKRNESLEFKIKSPLLNRISLANSSKRWVDIEGEFFEEILENISKSNFEPLIKRTNSDLEFIQLQLTSYLKDVVPDLPRSKIDLNIKQRFIEQFNPQDFSYYQLEKDELSPKKILFLNFNYTKTLDQYVADIRGFNHQNIEVNHIHGTLGNNPIFGFGDELNTEYRKFESMKSNELFKHIKSFHYSRNSEYFNLIRFTESEPYQVSIFGHSCGLSDRTMLKEIFENKNCLSIKIFHYKSPDGKDDFFEKTCEIYRHFDNKGEARKKIVPFESHHNMIQVKI